MSSGSTYCVYVHRNPANGKVYVGCTKKKLSARFDNGNGYRKCTRLWQDIIKYGFDNFDHIVIQDKMTREQALALEEVLVDVFDTMNPEKGYNMRRGGAHNTPCPEVGQAISRAKMGHVVTEETRQKLRLYGKRPVVQIAIDGELVATFPSLTEAATAVGAQKPNIYAVCAGKKSTAKGYRWEYLDDYQSERR